MVTLRNLLFVVVFSTYFVALMAKSVENPVTQDIPQISNPSAKLGKETALLDNLIETTRQNLESQKKLRELLQEYTKLQQQYVQNTQDKQLSYKIVKKAQEVLEKIQDQHLAHTFDQELMSELTFFSNISAKWNTPK